MEHAGWAPRSVVLLAENNVLHKTFGTKGNDEFEVMIKASRVESH